MWQLVVSLLLYFLKPPRSPGPCGRQHQHFSAPDLRHLLPRLCFAVPSSPAPQPFSPPLPSVTWSLSSGPPWLWHVGTGVADSQISPGTLVVGHPARRESPSRGPHSALSLWRLPRLPLQVHVFTGHSCTPSCLRAARWGLRCSARPATPSVPSPSPCAVDALPVWGAEEPCWLQHLTAALSAVPAWSPLVVGTWSLFFTWVNPVQTLSFTGRGALLLTSGGLRWLGAVALPQWPPVKARPQLPSPGILTILACQQLSPHSCEVCFLWNRTRPLVNSSDGMRYVLAKVGWAQGFVPSGFKAHASTRLISYKTLAESSILVSLCFLNNLDCKKLGLGGNLRSSIASLWFCFIVCLQGKLSNCMYEAAQRCQWCLYSAFLFVSVFITGS